MSSTPLRCARVQGKRTSLKVALMDQRVVAGLGNIYVTKRCTAPGCASPSRLDNCHPFRRAARQRAPSYVFDQGRAARSGRPP
jgi:hypothetical protein